MRRLSCGLVLLAALALAPAAAHAGNRYLVAGTDQATEQVQILDPKAEALRWSWAPAASTPGWDNVDEAKLRYSRRYRGHFLLTTASGGFVGLIHYPSGRTKWSVNSDDGQAPLDNPHSAELLPDGNVAAAASTGGWVRVYTASVGAGSTTHAQYALPGGHGVLWDPERRVLWALGDDHLVELEVDGTRRDPVLTEVKRTALPTLHGHDLQPVYGDTDRLWITTNAGVYQYSKSADAFSAVAPELDKPFVKAVSNNPATGQVLETRPKAGCATTWCTDTLEFYGPTATWTLPGAQFYKARWWVADYQ
jgi:hypothetical protein